MQIHNPAVESQNIPCATLKRRGVVGNLWLIQSLYTMRALVGLVDHAYYSCGVPALRWGSPTCLALMDFVTIRTEG
jgi:hypothetical protein